MTTTTVPAAGEPGPDYPQMLGHPRPLWMLFMAEFWERFAFYGMRWALTLYIVAQFFGGDEAGQASASRTYGAYLALVYATAVFGGYIADKIIGYQRSILLGAVVMAAGLFMIMVPNHQIFMLGLSTVIVGNGLFKPNISSMVGQLYAPGDSRRDRGFTLFYMGINAGALIAPVLTSMLATHVFGTPGHQNYDVVFCASGIGMLISLVWFWFGRRQLQGIGRPIHGEEQKSRVLWVLLGAIAAIPLIYFLLAIDASNLQWVLSALFVGLCAMIMVEGFRDGPVARDKALAMLIIFAFNVLFWMFFEQAGSSFNFLAQNIVDRDLGGWIFPIGWFQSVNSIAILTLAPLIAWIWI
jgi:POT family proton-dependent oligopeptide transporter